MLDEKIQIVPRKYWKTKYKSMLEKVTHTIYQIFLILFIQNSQQTMPVTSMVAQASSESYTKRTVNFIFSNEQSAFVTMQIRKGNRHKVPDYTICNLPQYMGCQKVHRDMITV